jgi:hypothetical protein
MWSQTAVLPNSCACGSTMKPGPIHGKPRRRSAASSRFSDWLPGNRSPSGVPRGADVRLPFSPKPISGGLKIVFCTSIEIR